MITQIFSDEHHLAVLKIALAMVETHPEELTREGKDPDVAVMVLHQAIEEKQKSPKRSTHDSWWKCNKCEVLNHPTHHRGWCNAPPPSSPCDTGAGDA